MSASKWEAAVLIFNFLYPNSDLDWLCILQDLRLVKEGNGAVSNIDESPSSNLDIEDVSVVEDDL